jgi:CHAT domain-containing protein/tetratricopeptide (TPR) repeat protein
MWQIIIARLVTPFVFFVGCTISLPQADTTYAALPQQATVSAEPAGPRPSPAVQEMLDEAKRLADAKQPLESLKAADQSLEAARRLNDTAGAALAQQARAKALQDLQRTDEALAAWHESARIWELQGDTPGQIAAKLQTGFLHVCSKKGDAGKPLEQGLSIDSLDSQKPVEVVQALEDSGVTLAGIGQDKLGCDYLSAALSVRERETFESVALAKTLNALAKVTTSLATSNAGPKYYHLSRDYSSRAAAMGQRLTPDSSILVESLKLLAFSEYLIDSGDRSAQKDYLEALRIQKKLAPDGSMEEASILRELGVLADQNTDFVAAHQYIADAVAIGERLAPESPLFERTLENLGNTESFEGDLSAAREHLLRALALKQKLHGNLAPTYLNLGVVAIQQYDFASARAYLENALAGFMKTNPNSAGVPYALGNLSEAFYQQGDFATALEYSQRSLAMLQERLGESIETSQGLSRIGDILLSQGKLNEAEDYFKRALALQMKLSPQSLNVALSLAALSAVAREQLNTSLAIEYGHQALELGQKSCPNSWCVTGILDNLGRILYEQGDLTGSESYLRRAVDIQEKRLGPTNPDVARSLNSLALTVAALGRLPEALEMALRAEKIGAEHLGISVRTLSERQSLAYEGIRASGLNLALTLAGDHANASSARGEILDVVIRSRALVFDELAARHRSAYGSGDPEVRQLADQLLSARTRLATLVFRGVGDTTPEVYRKLLDDARENKEKAERILAEKSIAFRQDEARTHLGLGEIETSLPQGTALVSFVRYAKYDLQKPGINNVAGKPVPSYAAFVLRAGKKYPEFVRLGAASEIENLLAEWRRDIARQAQVMDLSANAADNTHRRFGAALRRKIWDPLVLELGDAREVFVVPDDALHLLNLASLPIGTSQYLIETGPLIYYLSTERDLVPADARHGEGILIVGNPAFDRTGRLFVASNQQPVPKTTTSGTASTLLRGSRSACGTFQSLRFPPLPASQQEVENIAALWRKSASGKSPEINAVPAVRPGTSELLQITGADASPEAFEQYAPGKRVLHVATHGFFLEGNCDSAMQRQSNINTQDANFLPATAENPLLLSGLAFAGANRRASAKPDQTDGILTAEEIAGINLEGVDWAVLSACDTGVGEIKIGEGVFGLRRAFQVAGAKTVIMSLWQVEDETTRQWMATLYREHFLTGKDTGESVRAASLQILRQRRAKHQSTHPFYWGAFIAAGDWH